MLSHSHKWRIASVGTLRVIAGMHSCTEQTWAKKLKQCSTATDHAVSNEVEDAASAQYTVQINLTTDRWTHQLAVKKLAIRLTKRFVRSHVIVNIRQLPAANTDNTNSASTHSYTLVTHQTAIIRSASACSVFGPAHFTESILPPAASSDQPTAPISY